MFPEQLTLHVQLRDETTFENFISGTNAILLSQLRLALSEEGEQFFYLWGSAGVGLSHLLQACCHEAHQKNLTAVYLSLEDKELSPLILEELEKLDVLCIDNIDAIAGNSEWEEALFHLYNRIRTSSTRFIVTAHSAPRELTLSLADLHSRLLWGMVYHIESLSEEEKLQALQLRARQRGFTLSDEVGKFLLTHYVRDMRNLFHILEHLDKASLSEKRTLTIPFVKKVLASYSPV